MSSISVGSMPSKSGLNTLSTTASIISPLPEQEPSPKKPASVSTRTSVAARELRTPERLNTCPLGGISARSLRVFTSVIITALLHLPILSLDHLAIDDNEIDFLVLSLIAFGIDPNHLGFVAFLSADTKQRQRHLAGAREIVVVILR